MPLADVELTLVAPAYNERECIEEFVLEAITVLQGLGRPFEIICVDDGSTDGTAEVLSSLKRVCARLRVIRLDRNHGQWAALHGGIQASRGRVIALIDADRQNDPADIVRLLAILEGPAGPTCVTGRRAVRRDSWLRRISS